MKRVFFLSLVSLMLLLCVPLAGCDSEKSMAGEEIAQIVEAVSANEDPDSCSFNMDLSVTVNLDVNNPFIPSTMSLKAEDVQGAIDGQDQELWIKVPLTIDTGIAEYDKDMTMELLIVDGWGYMNAGDGWTKMELSHVMWEGQTQSLPIGQIIDLIALEDIEYSGTGSVNGVACNVFHIAPDIAEMAEGMFQQLGMGDSGLEEILSSFSVDCKFWIAEADNQVMKARLDLNGSLSSDEIPDLGIGGFGNITVNFSAEVVFDDVSIPTPPENAQVVTELPFNTFF